MSDEKNKARKVVTPEFRVSFPNVFKAKAFKDDQPKRFSITMLFDKKTDIRKLKLAAEAAASDMWGAKVEQMRKKIKWPWRDADAEEVEYDGYEGCIFIGASSKEENPPEIVDGQLEPIIEAKDFYAGCYARASLYAVASDHGTKRVSFILNSIQKTRNGKPFGNKTTAKDTFEIVEDDSDNEENYSDDDDMI